MNTFYKKLIAAFAIMNMPLEKQDAKELARIMGELQNDVTKMTGEETGYDQMVENVKTLQATVNKQAEDIRKMTKMGLGLNGRPKLVMSAAEARAMQRTNCVFRDNETAKLFGAVAITLLAKNGRKVDERILGIAKEFMDEYDAKQAKDLDPGVPASGGYLVADVFVADLIAHMETVGNVFPLCQRVPFTTLGKTTWPKRIGGMTAYAVAPATEPGKSNPTFDAVDMTPTKWMTLSAVPNEFFANPSLLVNLGQWLALEIVRANGYAWDNGVLYGDGTATYGGMVGLLTTAGGFGQKANVDTHTTLALTDGTDVSNVIGALNVDYVTQPYWLMSLSVERRLRALKASYGMPLYTQGANGEPNAIDGYPYNISQLMPAAADCAVASSKFALFGDIRLAMMFGMLAGLEIEQSTEAAFSSDVTLVRSRAYVQNAVIDPNAVVVAKTAAA